MHRDQHVDRRCIAVFDWTWRLALHHAFGAEVFEDQQALVQISLEDARRGQPETAQAVGHRDEGPDVLGKVRDLAVRLAVAHRRTVRSLRRVHQDRLLVAERQPLVGAA